MAADVRTRRWDDPPRPGDGLRVLVCRYRPRALPKADETWDVWWKDLAPSVGLHAAVYGKGQDPIDWHEYRRRFLREMAVEPARAPPGSPPRAVPSASGSPRASPPRPSSTSSPATRPAAGSAT